MKPLRRPLHWLSAVLLPALLLCAGPVLALKPDKAFTHFVIDQWSIHDGLPQISGLSLAQDRTGYLWVGTQSGLARFDGVRFVTFDPETVPALPGIWIRALLADRQGRLWIGTYKGLAVYEDGRFRQVPARDAARFASLDIFSLVERVDGAILAGTSHGVFEVSGDRLVKRPGPSPALSLLSRPDGLWVGTTGAVERIAGNSEANLPLPTGTGSAAVVRLVDTQGQLWAGTSQGLYVLAADGWKALRAHPVFDGSPVTAMLADRDGNLWVGSNAGLGRFRDGALTEFVPDTNPRAYPQVTAALEDREGNLWLGSQLNGIARLWNGWTRRYSVGEGLDDPIVWSLSPAPDAGSADRIWVGSNDGLSLFDNGHFKLVIPGKALPHPHAYNLLAEADRVWIGTRRGLVIWRNGHLETPPEVAPMASAQINGIVRDNDGSVWFPTSNGLFHLVGKTLKRFGPAEGLVDPRVRVIAFDREHRLLLGTQSGLWQLRDGRVQRYGRAGAMTDDIDISAMLPLQDGRLVVGSLAGRLLVQAGNRWHSLGPDNGLPGNSPFFLSEGPSTGPGKEWLWIAGIRGISRVRLSELPTAADTVTRSVHGEMILNERGDPNSGQQGYCCNGAGMSKGFRKDGVLWLPSRDGVVALDMRDIVKNPMPPSLVIERVGTPDGWRAPSATPGKRLVLPASARDLNFEFTALSFQDPASIQLRYRLQGYDRNWHQLDDARRRSANYTNLPPGNYTFELIGANNAGVWSRQPALLGFRIQPLFHETWLFRLLLASLLGMLVYSGYRFQLQRHAQQRSALEDQVQSRTRELHAANARLEKASQTDPLTGLRNRRYLANQIPADLAYYDRERKRSGEYDQVLVFALVDLDFFKHINDMHGHRAGDQVLLQVSQVLGSLARSSDYLARWGGEEFLLVFRPMAGRHLETIGSRIRSAISNHAFDVGLSQPLRITCSIGLSEYPLFRDAQHGLGWEQMVELADAALYWVKQNGRDGWAAFRPTMLTDVANLMRDLQQGADLMQADHLQLLTSRSTDGQSRP
ncbi:ligand-binding sensor domain-containing diguanylate cyclase [Cognatiluteimonas profundi]|uniref:ligand-binding sensor domain-containing diguanylate cyclase n=1 Tax=Cognatiluteimonas profundi TaxID=2594501 RepID=UPI00131DF6DA|nr:ligand-binding sensor domain-containing diguanylate cyclase [Lysobacter profundi]